MGGDRTNAERQRRYIARLKSQAAKAGVSNATAGPDHAALVQELAQAKALIAELQAECRLYGPAILGIPALNAEIAALKAELARERSTREAAEAKHSKPGSNVDDEDQSDKAAADGPMGKRVFKLVLRLDSPNDNEALLAARKLVRELKANGSDIRTLAAALETEWEKQQKAKPAPPPSIDFSEVEAAVKSYAADRTTVRFNLMWKALVAEVPALGVSRGTNTTRYIMGCLRRLGFAGSSSGRTWHRNSDEACKAKPRR
jgi:uncharacterized small protein (DUF1192 family)